MKLVGDNLIKLRKQFGLTQKELAERTDVSRETINKIENNKTNPTIEIIYLICSKLGVNINRLINDPKDLL